MNVFDEPTYVRAHRVPATAAFWTDLESDHAAAPPVLQELAAGEDAVQCHISEANTAVTWARAHPSWPGEPEPVWVASEPR